jgi:hypothetical protein
MKIHLVLSCALVIAGVAHAALNLAEKKQLQAWKDYLSGDESYAKSVKDKCGIDVPVTVDEKMVKPFMEANAHAAAYCDHTRSTIASMCEDATSKAEIVKKVKKVECKLGKTDEVSLKLSGTTLVFTVGTGGGNLGDKVKEWLEKNL